MTLKSMTGYGSQEGQLELDGTTFSWHWDVRSVNGKGLDIRLRLPPFLSDLDQALRKALQGSISRGNIQASLQFESHSDDESFSVNENALRNIVSVAKKLSDEHDLPRPSIEGLLALRGVLDTHSSELAPEEKKGISDALLASFSAAIDALITSRIREGKGLNDVLHDTLSEIEKLVNEAIDAPERNPEKIRLKLRQQLDELLETGGDLSEDRLHQEALLMAAKADIKEELDRLVVHIDGARTLLAEDKPIGRRLDFLAQEFNREANTVCSKANDIAVTNIGLALKAAIEQFREQIQNVE